MKYIIYLLSLFPLTIFANEFVKIPANPNFSFVKGVERGSIGEKSPILKPYEIAKYPITNEEYKKFLSENKNIKVPKYWKNGTFPKGKEKHPVLDISLTEAKAYCLWLSKKDKKFNYRIPTEAEWEFAAIGNTKNSYPWGNDAGSLKKPKFNFNGLVVSILLKNPSQQVKYIHPKSIHNGKTFKLSEVVFLQGNRMRGWKNHRDYTGFAYTDVFKKLSDEGGYTTPVDKFPEGKSPFGVMDMSGNSWDWTDSEIIATNGAERGKKVNAVRGGSWYAMARSCEATYRGEGRKAGGHYNTIGFRLVREQKK